MLACLAPGPFDSQDHVFELKWDGVRTMAYLERDGRTRLFSRRLHDVTALYPELAGLGRAVQPTILPAVIDGEIVCLQGGKPSFEDLQHRFTARDPRTIAEGRKRFPVVFVVFDLLYDAGSPILTLPLVERRKSLAEAVGGRDAGGAESGSGDGGGLLVHSEFISEFGKAFAEAAFLQGLEGVMAKEAWSPYEPGRRSRAWLKIKRPVRERFFIGGANFHSDGRLGSIEVGRLSPDGGLLPVGAVGSGIGEAAARQLIEALLPLEQAESPFCGPLSEGATPFRRASGGVERLICLWVRPSLTCQVEYLERTERGALRHPVYKGDLQRRALDADSGDPHPSRQGNADGS